MQTSTYLESTRAIYFQTHLPLRLWAKYVFTTMYIINHLLTPLLSRQTPFEWFYGKIPSYSSHLKVFGHLANAINVHVSHKFTLQAKRYFSWLTNWSKSLQIL